MKVCPGFFFYWRTAWERLYRICSHLLEADICLEGRRLLRLASDVLLDLDITRSEWEWE